MRLTSARTPSSSRSDVWLAANFRVTDVFERDASSPATNSIQGVRSTHCVNTARLAWLRAIRPESPPSLAAQRSASRKSSVASKDGVLMVEPSNITDCSSPAPNRASTLGTGQAGRQSDRRLRARGDSTTMAENIEEEVPLWAARGARYAALTHFGNNQFGGSSNPNLSAGDPVEDPGLTDLGRRLVELLNDHGIMVDISHVGPQTSLEAIEMSRAPVIASHSGARAVYDHPRNLTDEILEAIRDNGGVAQMVAFRGYIRPIDPGLTAAIAELRTEFGLDQPGGWERSTPESRAEYQERVAALRSEFPDATVSDVADHIDHAVSVAGIDHVGIVSDFDGGGGVRGWDDASETPNVTAELLRRGYSEEDIAKLWGGNVLRVMRAVEAAAR